MARSRRRRLSKYLSLVLRHVPERARLELDPRGFAPIEALVRAADRALPFPVTRADIEALCEAPEHPAQKQRYIREGDFVRAGHGHSVPISGYREVEPKERLFHATPTHSVQAIRSEGLKSMGRDKVHLSTDRPLTLEAARRRGKDITMIEVVVEAAGQAGVRFYESADPRVFLSDDIPPSCLVFDDG